MKQRPGWRIRHLSTRSNPIIDTIQRPSTSIPTYLSPQSQQQNISLSTMSSVDDVASALSTLSVGGDEFFDVWRPRFAQFEDADNDKYQTQTPRFLSVQCGRQQTLGRVLVTTSKRILRLNRLLRYTIRRLRWGMDYGKGKGEKGR
ncbi:hypothetical protein B0T17DRAFT_602823 [Bombardia bombarda]|uniref:Uncharacterized protein n=1 Tax=Bombardia bombarda TaxID=252184 RepID=A0AA39W4S9_9PEZI|nr:hypothetical protein B0T17DRAFT_602823 [Bombardia bombarda]